MKLVINERKCPAMKDICQAISACPNGALSYIVDETAPLGGKIIVDVAQCKTCGNCVDACCGSAIALI